VFAEGCIGSSAEGRLSRQSAFVEDRPVPEGVTLRPALEEATLRLGDDEGIPYLSIGSGVDAV